MWPREGNDLIGKGSYTSFIFPSTIEERREGKAWARKITALYIKREEGNEYASNNNGVIII